MRNCNMSRDIERCPDEMGNREQMRCPDEMRNRERMRCSDEMENRERMRCLDEMENRERMRCPDEMKNRERMMENYEVAMAYVPWQQFTDMYEPGKGLEIGTIFPELDKPFWAGGRMCR